jgi:hypothetical protein
MAGEDGLVFSENNSYVLAGFERGSYEKITVIDHLIKAPNKHFCFCTI